jgi:peptidoglycan/LPS O-acetylase OafA/YrhL
MPHNRNLFDLPVLSELDKGRENNLNLVRFLLASAVILTHSYGVFNDMAHEPLLAVSHFIDCGSLSVLGFFFISGYLILKSALRWSSPEQFIASRFLRIFPGLAIAVILAGAVLGPLVSVLPVKAYFVSPATRAFFSELWMHRMRHPLPGVFEHNPDPFVVNASLWTLPVEWTMYVATLLICLVTRWRANLGRFSAHTWIVVIATVLLTAQMIPQLPWQSAEVWIKCFCIGAVFYLLRCWIKLSLPAAAAFLAFDIALIHFHVPHSGGAPFLFALCYLMFAFGFHPAVRIAGFHRFGDYSYGLYIYAWPLQQLLVPYFHRPLQLFAASYLLALIAAILSWRYIEAPSLALKIKVKRELGVAQKA